MSQPPASPRRLIHAVLDGCADAADVRRLETLALADRSVLRMYVDAVNLHAAMQWDYGPVMSGEVSCSDEEFDRDAAALLAGSADYRTQRRRSIRKRAIALVALAVVAAFAVLVRKPADNDNSGNGRFLVASDPASAKSVVEGDGPLVPDAGPDAPAAVPRDEAPVSPVLVASADNAVAPTDGDETDIELGTPEMIEEPTAVASSDRTIESERSVVSFINGELERRWADEDVHPSRVAGAEAWLRRASLDLKGRIPTRDEIARFVAEPEASRKDTFVAEAIASGEYADHFATVWSNLLVGRSATRAKNRERLHGYLSDAFAENRSWGQVVGELVSAEGTEDHAPTNFLLAHLNNEAVPATAITSRVLLGRQVQCTQCHHHPFNDWKQDEFWQLNAFFQQCEVESRVTDGGVSVKALVDRPRGGPTYFETLRGVMQVAYPIYEGERLPESGSVPRRRELARLLVTGETNDLAVAMVNRVWAHFMGAGFTREVDDIGPHADVSHPELLDRLAREFVSSGYDVRQLVSWITASEAYQLETAWHDGNAIDRPEHGELALFSRVYEKPLSPEQLYDSLVTASAGPRQSIPGLPSRTDWVAEFYAAQDNEENGEMSTFDASPSVALELMNGRLMSQLVASPKSKALEEVLDLDADEDTRLDAVSQLVLGRGATPDEKKTLRKVIRPTIAAYARSLPRGQAIREGYRDLFWAYVNSSEFVINR